MAGTPLDVNLDLFDDDMNDANEGNGTAVTLDGPGPYDAELHVAFGAVTGTNPTFDAALQVSVDGGSNWVETATLRQFTDADAPEGGESRFHFSRPVFIPRVPRPSSPAWSTASPDSVQVRLVSAVTGSSTPQFADCLVWLAPPDVGNTPARRV